MFNDPNVSILDVLADGDSYIAINLFTAETGFGVFVVDGEITTARLTDHDYEGLYLAAEKYRSPFSPLMDEAASWAYSDAAEADAMRKWEDRHFPNEMADDACLEQYQPDRDIGFDDDFIIDIPADGEAPDFSEPTPFDWSSVRTFSAAEIQHFPLRQLIDRYDMGTILGVIDRAGLTTKDFPEIDAYIAEQHRLYVIERKAAIRDRLSTYTDGKSWRCVAAARFNIFEAEAVSLPWVLAQQAKRRALEAEGRWSNTMICECEGDADLPF